MRLSAASVAQLLALSILAACDGVTQEPVELPDDPASVAIFSAGFDPNCRQRFACYQDTPFDVEVTVQYSGDPVDIVGVQLLRAAYNDGTDNIGGDNDDYPELVVATLSRDMQADPYFFRAAVTVPNCQADDDLPFATLWFFRAIDVAGTTVETEEYTVFVHCL